MTPEGSRIDPSSCRPNNERSSSMQTHVLAPGLPRGCLLVHGESRLHSAPQALLNGLNISSNPTTTTKRQRDQGANNRHNLLNLGVDEQHLVTQLLPTQISNLTTSVRGEPAVLPSDSVSPNCRSRARSGQDKQYLLGAKSIKHSKRARHPFRKYSLSWNHPRAGSEMGNMANMIIRKLGDLW